MTHLSLSAHLQDELKRLFGAFKSWADEAKDGTSWRVTVHGAVRRRLFTSMIRKKGGGYDRFVVACERDGAGGRVPQCMVITKALTKKTRKAKRTQDVRGKQTCWGGASVVAYQLLLPMAAHCKCRAGSGLWSHLAASRAAQTATGGSLYAR